MVAALDSRTVIFSDGASAIGMWIRETPTAFNQYFRFTYDASLGIANSATLVKGKPNLLITGHAGGFAVVWEWRDDSLVIKRTVDLRSPDPIPSPYQLKNIRGLATSKNGVVLSGSEDGDIVGFKPGDGTILFRQRYNKSAERGINNITLEDDTLLVANCSVGSSDKNLWLYSVSEAGVRLMDAINLVKDTSLSQSFDFDVDLAGQPNGLKFFASTQEGLVWFGSIDSDRIKVEETAKVDSEGGAVLDLNQSGKLLAAAAQQIVLFEIR